MKGNDSYELKVRNPKEMILYEKGMELVQLMYGIASKLPDIEKYEMATQIRSAATSITANIAEGDGQVFKRKEFNFANNALGSANELRCWMHMAFLLKYINKDTYDAADAKIVEVIKITFGYMKKLNKELAGSES